MSSETKNVNQPDSKNVDQDIKIKEFENPDESDEENSPKCECEDGAIREEEIQRICKVARKVHEFIGKSYRCEDCLQYGCV